MTGRSIRGRGHRGHGSQRAVRAPLRASALRRPQPAGHAERGANRGRVWARQSKWPGSASTGSDYHRKAGAASRTCLHIRSVAAVPQGVGRAPVRLRHPRCLNSRGLRLARTSLPAWARRYQPTRWATGPPPAKHPGCVSSSPCHNAPAVTSPNGTAGCESMGRADGPVTNRLSTNEV